MSTRLTEYAGVAVVIAGIVAPPIFGHYYEAHRDARLLATASRGGTVHLYHITGIAKPGMWTLDNREGWNYWWKRPRRLKEINVRKGDTVVITLTSADVQHAFTIPALGITDVEVDPGHRRTIRFVADRAGSFPFLCATVCSCTGGGFACTLTKKQGHEGMTGVLNVTEPLGPANVRIAETISDEKGFEPSTIRVRQGDVVEITVTSRSDGIGKGVGFCISEYETTVDLEGIPKGESRTFKFRADKAGSFMIYSSTKAGDRIDNANGTFVVTASPGK